MAEIDDRAPADTADGLKDGPRPQPATPPVIDAADIEAPAATPPPTGETPAIESSLLGEGGLPAAARPTGDDAAEPPANGERTGTDSEAVAATHVVDAPDPGPIPSGDGPPPILATDPQGDEGRRGGFWPLVLGGVVAAGLGSAATIWAMPQLRPQAQAIDQAALTSEAVAAAEAAVSVQADALLARAAEAGATAGAEAAQQALAAAPASTARDEGLPAQIEDRLAALGTLQERVKALEERPAPEATAPQQQESTPAATADEIEALRQQVAAQSEQLDELAARPQIEPQALEQVRALASSADEVQQRLNSAAEAAQQRLAAVEDKTNEVQQTLADAGRRAETLAALTSLQATLRSGGDREAAVQSLAAAGIDTPDELTAAAPSLEALQQRFPAAARDGLAASLRDASADSSSGFFANFLRAQTGARSLEPRAGDDPDAVLSRAGAAVDSGDIAGALNELQALPPAGRAAMADWLQGAEAWAAASAAVGKIEDNLK